jgi:hypothetical protein
LNNPPTPFNASSHAYLRIRHDTTGGVDNIVFEAGPSPNQWTTTLKTVVRDLPITSIRPELKAGTFQNEPVPPQTVKFDNFRMAVPQQ